MSFEILYETITGQILEEFAVIGAENLFADGQPCGLLYAQVESACERIQQNLGAEESADLNLIVDSMEQICKTVAREVFRFCVYSSFK